VSTERVLRPPLRAFRCIAANRRWGPIVLQKSQNAVRLILRRKTKQPAIADRYARKLVTEVAREFITW
jgi:hypothetical protein